MTRPSASSRSVSVFVLFLIAFSLVTIQPARAALITTSTTVAASPGATIALGDTVKFTATVTATSGTPAGLVTFYDGATPLGSGILNGVVGNDQASFSTTLLSVSASGHSITATYQGSTTFSSSTSTALTEIVTARTTTTGVALAPTTVVIGEPSAATVTLTDTGASVPPGTPDTFSSTGAPATGRTGFTATLFEDGLVLVAGGADKTPTVLKTAEIYSASGGSFAATGNLNTARTGAVAVLLPSGKVLVAGGSSDGTATGALNTAELYDPVAGTFALSTNTMKAARLGAVAVLLNDGKVLLAGGEDSGGVLNSAELYDPKADTFTATGTLNAARSGAAGVLLGTAANAKVLVAGGSSDGTANGALNSAELFDPSTGTFAPITSKLGALRWQPEAAPLLSGKVLVAGGANSGGALSSADIYDPTADTFSPSSSGMAQGRFNGSAILLPNGMVLLAGGTTNQAVDLYDADSDKFDATGSLLQSDNGLIGTLLNNGDVLFVGLTGGGASDAELYSPSFAPLGTFDLTSSETTDAFSGACILVPSTATKSTCAPTVTPVNVGTSPHTITATYPADAVHATSNNTANLTVNKADTTTAVTSSANPSVFGQPVTFSATVSAKAPGAGTPTGNAQLVIDGTPVETKALSAGSVSFTPISTLSVGAHTVDVNYLGDSNFNTSPGHLPTQNVNKADTTTTVSSDHNPSVWGQLVTFSAIVSAKAPGAGTPTGNAQLVIDGAPVETKALSGGSVLFTAIGTLSVGAHTVDVNYLLGDTNFNPSTGHLPTQTVNKADTITATPTSVPPSPSTYGQAITFSTTVTAKSPGAGTPTGKVQFFIDGTAFGSPVTLDSKGAASIATLSCTAGTALTAATHSVTAQYTTGDTDFNPSPVSSALSQVVNKAPTSTTITNVPPPLPPVFTWSTGDSVSTQTVTITANAKVTSTPACALPAGENMSFTDTPVNNPQVVTHSPIDGSGNATYTGNTSTAPLPGDHHSFTANYVGDSNFQASSQSPAVNQDVWDFTLTTASLFSVPFGYALPMNVTVQGVGGLWGAIANSCPAKTPQCIPSSGLIPQPPQGGDNSITLTPQYLDPGQASPGRTLASTYTTNLNLGFTNTPSQANPVGTLTRSTVPQISVITNPLPICVTATGGAESFAPELAINSDLSITATFRCSAGLPVTSSIGSPQEGDDVMPGGNGFTIDFGDGNGEVTLNGGVPTGANPLSKQSPAPYSAGSYTIKVKTLDRANGVDYLSAAYIVNSTPSATRPGVAVVVAQPKGVVFDQSNNALPPNSMQITLQNCLVNGLAASKFAMSCSYDNGGVYMLPASDTINVTINTNVVTPAGPSLAMATSFGVVGGILLMFAGWRQRVKGNWRSWLLFAISALTIGVLILSLGCGGGFNNTNQGNITPPGTYTITITGTDTTSGAGQARVYAVTQVTVLKQ